MTNPFLATPAELLSCLTPLGVEALDTHLQVITAQCMHCLDASITPSDYCFFDLNTAEQFSDFIEQVEALPQSKRLLLAMSLLAEILLLVGQRQAAVTAPPFITVVTNGSGKSVQ